MSRTLVPVKPRSAKSRRAAARISVLVSSAWRSRILRGSADMGHFYHLTTVRLVILSFQSLDIRSSQSEEKSTMTQTQEAPSGLEHPTVVVGRTPAGDISTRAAGWGAVTFAVTVIAQNLIRGATAPTNGASAREVLSHYADHRSVMFVLAGTYVVSGIGLAVFLGGAMRRLLAGSRRGWALTGLVGATSVMTMFALVVAAEQALIVAAHMDNPDLGAIQALWALHNSIFTVLDFSIAAALLGLSRAAVADGMTPRPFTFLAPIGAAMLLVGTLGGPAIAAGQAMVLFAVTGLGFLVWLAFLLVTGFRLVRSEQER